MVSPGDTESEQMPSIWHLLESSPAEAAPAEEAARCSIPTPAEEGAGAEEEDAPIDDLDTASPRTAEAAETEEVAEAEEAPAEEEAAEEAPAEEESSDDVDYSSMTVAELKVLLKEAGKPVSGKKAELIERLQE